MDYLTENVAVNLKRIRQSKGMSLDQASEQTGVSKSMLSQIEKQFPSVNLILTSSNNAFFPTRSVTLFAAIILFKTSFSYS